jgi:hypothetical protein
MAAAEPHKCFSNLRGSQAADADRAAGRIRDTKSLITKHILLARRWRNEPPLGRALTAHDQDATASLLITLPRSK